MKKYRTRYILIIDKNNIEEKPEGEICVDAVTKGCADVY